MCSPLSLQDEGYKAGSLTFFTSYPNCGFSVQSDYLRHSIHQKTMTGVLKNPSEKMTPLTFISYPHSFIQHYNAPTKNVANCQNVEHQKCSRQQHLISRKRQRYFFPPAGSTTTIKMNTPTSIEATAGTRYNDDGTRLVPVPLFIHGTCEESVCGVYEVLDENRETVYIGMSRDVAASLEAHVSRRGDEIIYVKAMTFEDSNSDSIVKEMKRTVDRWILDNETTPIGNIENWYEVDEELTKQGNLLSPIELIEEDPSRIISPFENDVINDDEAEFLELSEDNVDMVLDKVRPFLIADGGNISVVNVNKEEGTVSVRLQGACGSCESSSTTMKRGVEKELRKRFGDQLKNVQAITDGINDFDDVRDNGIGGLSVERCELALESIRDVLNGLGADVSVMEVDEDEVIVNYRGPNNLKFGIEQTLREKVPNVTVVTFE